MIPNQLKELKDKKLDILLDIVEPPDEGGRL